MTEIAVTREGRGPELLLVHGGASPQTTREALRPLARRWTLVLVHRRGYSPNPPADHDFDLDAADLTALLGSRPHVVAHSYGTLGALIAAGKNPGAVRSLTLIEPPLFYLAPDEPGVQRLERIGNEVLAEGLDARPATLRRFLRLAGAPRVPEGPLSPDLVHSVRRAHGGRPPGEARPSLQSLCEAKVPALVASGGHLDAFERICDALAAELDAERIVVPGAGHFVQREAGFSEHLVRHLSRAR
jgi:pimeloyl-ACP methyl ester carboxylesterase